MNFVAKGYGGGFWHVFNHMLFSILKGVLDIIYKFRWRHKNKHNVTELKHFVDINKVSVGNYTLGILDVRLSPVKNSYVKIGSYCCIAPEVEFLGLANHPTDWLMLEWICDYYKPSRQFKLLYGQTWKGCKLNSKDVDKLKKAHLNKMEKTCKGPIIVDDDVWIGTGAKIMSGVHIGQGAVIAAGSVVTKDIPPYAIAGGVPAKVIKYRFEKDVIDDLLKIDFSNVSMEKLSEIYPETIKEDFDVKKILNFLQ